jgi:hypothetical protein
MDMYHVFIILLSLIGIFCLALTFTYVDKLEKIGCECAKHPYRNYIKGYTIFAIIYIALMMLLPAKMISNFGNDFGVIYGIINVIFVVASFLFAAYLLIYTRFLMKEKCKCSEDIRREVLYIYSIIEIILLSFLVTLPVLLTLIGSSLGVVMGLFNDLNKKQGSTFEAITDPVKSARRIPDAVRKIPSQVRKTIGVKKR